MRIFDLYDSKYITNGLTETIYYFDRYPSVMSEYRLNEWQFVYYKN